MDIHTRRRLSLYFVCKPCALPCKVRTMMVVFKTDMGLIFQKYTSEGCEILEPECDWVSRGCGNRVTRKKITKYMYSDGLRRED